jgi:hypothetical protein
MGTHRTCKGKCISYAKPEFPLSKINKVADMLNNSEIKGRPVTVPE